MPDALPIPDDLRSTLDLLEDVMMKGGVSLKKGIETAYELGFHTGQRETAKAYLAEITLAFVKEGGRA